MEFYIIDLETNGMRAGFNEVNELSIIRCSDRHQVTKFIKAEYPERSNMESLHFTGKSIQDIIQGESREDVVKFCNAFIEQDGQTPDARCFVGHSVSFDRRFTHALWESVEKLFKADHWLDTMNLAKEWTKKIGIKPENFKLGTVLKFANIKSIPGPHQAEVDARNTYMFWKKAMDNKVNYVTHIKHHPHILKED